MHTLAFAMCTQYDTVTINDGFSRKSFYRRWIISFQRYQGISNATIEAVEKTRTPETAWGSERIRKDTTHRKFQAHRGTGNWSNAATSRFTKALVSK